MRNTGTTTNTTKGETMSTPTQLPADVIFDQHSAILEAIALLQGDLDAMTSDIDPDTESWRDVSKFAHVAEMARGIIERYEDQ